MKSLLYKELKLCMHPLIYLFVFIFPLMALIPSYPIAISFIYICTSYPILFLGANKGQQSNDIYFSSLLPVRRKDIVKARMILLSIIQVISMLLLVAIASIGSLYKDDLLVQEGASISDVGFTFNQMGAVIAFVLVGYSLYDLIFVTCFYKNGRAIVLPSLLGMFTFIIELCLTTIVLPAMFKDFFNFFTNVIVQVVSVLISLSIYFLLHCLTYRRASKLFERVDF